MMSNLGRHVPRNLDRELARAYDGEVPPPYYLQIPAVPRHAGPRHHPGAIETTLPHQALPPEFLFASAVSLEALDELVERRARQEEVAPG
jgi:hypothetical protein